MSDYSAPFDAQSLCLSFTLVCAHALLVLIFLYECPMSSVLPCVFSVVCIVLSYVTLFSQKSFQTIFNNTSCLKLMLELAKA